MTVLLAWLAATASGEGAVALVAGEPGIGKTRLLAELGSRARAAGWTVLSGRAYDSEGMPPYLPFVEALRSYVRSTSVERLRTELGPGAAEFALLVPELRDLTPEPLSIPGASPEQQRYRLFESVCDVLDAAARGGETGLLLTLDDLHWADPPTLRLLRHLARRLDRTPLLVVAYRTVELDASIEFNECLAALAHEGSRGPLLLASLRLEETVALAESIAGGEVSGTVATAIQRATEGNPFFIGEVVRNLRAQGRELGHADATSCAWAVPELVRQVISARLARLQSSTIDLLRHGAVLGDGFTFEVVRSASGLEEAAALTAIEEAIAAGMLRAEGDSYYFAHALIRRTLYDALSPARRQRLHLRAAEAIESVHAGHLDPHVPALAGHYRLAGEVADPGTAIEYAMQAGAAAQAVLAWEDAAAHWRAALQMMEDHDIEPVRRAEVLERLGDLMYYTDSDRRVGITYLERALTLYESLGRQQTVAKIHTRIGRFMSSTPYIRNVPRILEHYRAAESVLSRGPEGHALCSLYVAMASTSISDVGTEQGLAASHQAMEMAKRLNDEALWADAARTHGSHLLNFGRLADGFAVLDRALDVADRLDHAIIGFWATMHHALIVRRLLLDPIDAVAWYERELGKPHLAQAPHLRQQMTAGLTESMVLAGRVADAHTQPKSIFPDPNNALAFAAGDWDEAARLQTAALDQARRAGDRNNIDWYASGLARVLRARGDMAEAEPLLQEALAVGIEGPRVPTELLSRADLALMCAELDRTAEAEAHLARCREILTGGEDWRGVVGRVILPEAVTAAACGHLRWPTDASVKRSSYSVGIRCPGMRQER
jgi:tetratricopeptide (TPR) repeat protein